MALDNGIVGREGFEFVVGRHKRVARGRGNVLGDEHVVPLGGVDARTDGGAAQRELLQMGQRVAKCVQPKLELRHIAPKLLTQRKWGRVHQMGSANLDNAVKRLGLGGQGIAQTLHPGEGALHNGRIRRNVHGGGKGVVGALALVHVVVGVDGAIPGPKGAAGQDMGAVGHHLVDVHVALGSRARLPHHQGKLVVQLACQNFLTRRDDEVFFARFEDAQLTIGQGRRTLEVRKSVHHLHGHGTHGANLEIVARTLGLGAPVFVGRNVNLSQRVFFNAGAHGGVGFQLMWGQTSSWMSAPEPAPIKKALRNPSKSPFITASTLEVSWPVRTSLTIL